MKRKTAPRRLTNTELEAAAKAFDAPNYTPRFARSPKSVQRRHDQALRNAKRAASNNLANSKDVQTLTLAGREFVILSKQQYERLRDRTAS
jgi:hypothetical protein